MIVITGGFTATPDTVDTLRAAALEHVRRSRGEDGCLSHDLYADAERPLRFFFFERWRYMAAVRAHFRVPASGGLVTLLREQAAAVEELSIHEAKAVAPWDGLTPPPVIPAQAGIHGRVRLAFSPRCACAEEMRSR